MAFPFEEVQPPDFDMALTWSLDDLLGYLGTWSATRRFMKTHSVNPVEQVEGELAEAWGAPFFLSVHSQWGSGHPEVPGRRLTLCFKRRGTQSGAILPLPGGVFLLRFRP